MSDAPSRMVDRVVLILNVFERSTGALTLGQISVRSGLPTSSVHRILQQLVTARWLQRDDNEYTLGLRMFEMGSLVGQRRISDVARPFIQELCTRTGHVVHLALLDELDVVYLEKVGGALASELPSRVGGRLPAHCTAVGKVLLAYAPQPVLDRYLANGLRGRTSASITTEAALEAALRKIRDTGYAMESDEAVPGVACVGAPIFEYGNAVAALSVCGHRKLIRVDDLKQRVMWTAAEISRRLTVPARPVAVG
ncbi:IclR family transcriptional regulator [Nocardia sp. NBC_00565]|uniref:IclR family transcriptional regulator n=1 Tax=Nocardia sp. NBC_00565 TaxID=2975993 RepID=UPI002E80D83C|nr:IclR family transcriptional regulator [Nocardia sp. NBC_00565]WUC06374.1 IclR family transcriptional regulator [Nocardia sp. NBC_00565]